MYRLSMQNVAHIKDCNNAAQVRRAKKRISKPLCTPDVDCERSKDRNSATQVGHRSDGRFECCSYF